MFDVTGGAQQKGEHSNQSSGGATEHGSSKDSGATSAKRDDIIALGDHNPRDNGKTKLYKVYLRDMW